MADLKPLPKKITNEIRKILEGCRDKTLKHEQELVHCGSAHCVCGWKAVFDYKKATRNRTIITADFGDWPQRTDIDKRVEKFCRKRLTAPTQDGRPEWAYATERWQLTKCEADQLFTPSATFASQFRLLKKLERGERVA